MVALAQGEPDRQTGVNADGSAAAHVKVTTGEIASDGCSLLFCQIAWPLVRPEGGGGSAGKSAVVVVVVLLGKIGRALKGGVHGGWREGLDGGWGVGLVVLGIGVGIGTGGAEAPFEAALGGGERMRAERRRRAVAYLAGQNLAAPGLAGVAGGAGASDGGRLGWGRVSTDSEEGGHGRLRAASPDCGSGCGMSPECWSCCSCCVSIAGGASWAGSSVVSADIRCGRTLPAAFAVASSIFGLCRTGSSLPVPGPPHPQSHVSFSLPRL